MKSADDAEAMVRDHGHCERDEERHLLVQTPGGTSIDQHYHFAEQLIGQGSFSIVMTARCIQTGMERAIKVIDKQVNTLQDAPQLENEIEILTAAEHHNIVRLLETFEDAQKWYLVMELCCGGDLFDRIVEVGELTEPCAALLVRQIASTVCYLHGQCVVHRDLKPDNFVFRAKGPLQSTPLKLVDFGLSRRFTPGETLTTAVGTVLYVAPEVLRQSYTQACDLWSLGAIIFNTLCGFPPFDGQTAKQVAKCVRKGKFAFEGVCWEPVSEDAKDLIRRLLTKDVDARLTAAQVLVHPWIEGLAANSSGEPLDSQLVRNLEELGEQSRRAKNLQRKHIAEQLSIISSAR